MTGWHAVVPIKPGADRKTRLRPHLAPDRIEALTEQMLWHVLDTLTQVAEVDTVTLIADARPSGWSGGWFADPGLGLNVGLARFARAAPYRLIVLHADLPALQPDDVVALVAAAGQGSALSPDRGGTGTNAMALVDATEMNFAFGANSFARHRALLPRCRIVDRPGLALDVDVLDDLALAQALGHL